MARNWFDQGGSAYAQFRPTYPVTLSDYLANLGPTETAADIGCGNGQLTCQLAEKFQSVIGIDPSADQIDNAMTPPNVRYLCAPAEALPLPNHSLDLISVAQAAHWFDLDKFYGEVRRVLRPNGVLALISYGIMRLGSQLDARFQEFYDGGIGPYWPPERKLVDTGYRAIAFPFDEIKTPDFFMEQNWDLPQFLGYIGTWSAVRNAREDGKLHILEGFSRDMTELWGDPTEKRLMRWPIHMRVGRVA